MCHTRAHLLRNDVASSGNNMQTSLWYMWDVWLYGCKLEADTRSGHVAH